MEEAAPSRRVVVAKQAEGWPDVVLRASAGTGEVVAKVPNGESLIVLQEQGESVKVRWNDKDGWAKAANLAPKPQAMVAIPELQGQQRKIGIAKEHLAEVPADDAIDASPHEASAKEFVQQARRVMDECMQDPPNIWVPKYTEPESLLYILGQHTQPVKLLRGTWVTTYAKTEGQRRGLPRRQDLEKTVAREAFLPREEVACKAIGGWETKCMNVISIDYCWRAAMHPDVDGLQLRAVASRLEQLLGHSKFAQYFPDAGVFWDFGSLHQKDERGHRTPMEQRAFDEAICNMGMWYLHALVMTFIVNMKLAMEPGVDYESRGWTLFTRSCAELIKPTFAGGSWDSWPMIIEFAESRRKLPLSPEAFAEQLAHRRFTNRGDKEMVVTLYAKTFMDAVRAVREINFASLKIQWQDGKRLASVLQHCCSVHSLTLASMGIDDAELQDIANVLPRMPSLAALDLAENQIGDAGAVAMASVLPYMPSLASLYLAQNQIGDAGAVAMASVLPNLPSFKALHLGCNKIGDCGADAIAAVLPILSREFKAISVHTNQLTEDGKTTLQQAWTETGRGSERDGLAL